MVGVSRVEPERLDITQDVAPDEVVRIALRCVDQLRLQEAGDVVGRAFEDLAQQFDPLRGDPVAELDGVLAVEHRSISLVRDWWRTGGGVPMSAEQRCPRPPVEGTAGCARG